MATARPFIHLRKTFPCTLAAPCFPHGLRPASFDDAVHPRPAHALLVNAYRHGGGTAGKFASWWPALRADPEYDPALIFLAVDRHAAIVGMAQCWTSAFLKELAVDEHWRRKGLGTALLLQAFRTFQVRGFPHLDLKVERRNASRALELYRRLGLRPLA